jgi:Pyruvate/2-oxoacid:ferredoxin oxidoreductase gamma subunit
MPRALSGAFRDEPRIVDLRWVDDPAELSLRHSQFRGQVAEVAAAIHGRPKDEIEADDIREHRRTLLAAWAASAALAVLTVGAVVAAILALSFASTARDNERQATANAAEARRQVRIAERNLKTAEEERRRARELAVRQVLEQTNANGASACPVPTAP